jgi:L,D-peptidoglycan transpeptidase YkuD (ErfK/YbiS/YcfS/YnhG family)
MLHVLATALLLQTCGGPPGARQLVTVVAPSYRTTSATVTLWSRRGGCWSPTAGPWHARVGRNGLSNRHREGDGTTPTGTYRFGSVVYGLDPDPGVRYRYHRLVCGDWWDEDPGSPTYNRFRHLPCGARPRFGEDSEALWHATVAYRHLAVVDYNAASLPGAGSGIFVHEDTGRATNGCVSLPAGRLVALLRWLRPAASPRIAIGTSAELAAFVR